MNSSILKKILLSLTVLICISIVYCVFKLDNNYDVPTIIDSLNIDDNNNKEEEINDKQDPVIEVVNDNDTESELITSSNTNESINQNIDISQVIIQKDDNSEIKPIDIDIEEEEIVISGPIELPVIEN